MVSPFCTLQSASSLRNSIASLAWFSASCIVLRSSFAFFVGWAKARNKRAFTPVFAGYAFCACANDVTLFAHGRGRDASYLAPPAQNRTCGFPAYGSHLGSNGERSPY